MGHTKPRLSFYDWIYGLLRALLAFIHPAGAVAIAVAFGTGVLLGTLYFSTQRVIRLQINDWLIEHRTHERSAEGVLRELGITLYDKDILHAPSADELVRGIPIRLIIARQVLLVHDGSITRSHTHAHNVAEVLADTDVVVLSHDHLFLEGKRCALSTALPDPPTFASRQVVSSLLEGIRRPIRIDVRRAVLLNVQDGAVSIPFYTTARTVGEALFEAGLVIYAGDRVFPDQSTRISPGLTISIERSKPVTLEVAGSKTALRTRTKTVRDLLQAEGMTLGPKDYVLPDPRTALSRELYVSVVRVSDEYLIEETPIAYETRWEPEPSLEIDQRQVKRWGREGARRQLVRIRYENGREVYRTETEEWTAREPLDRIYSYGTKIVLRTIETPSGEMVYWRKLRMLATSYSAATAGTALSLPWYGKTRLGLRAGKGIVAVDPQVINLGQNVYVPDYGLALAADTGGAIRGRRIDLCYDDDNLVLWYRWVDVYVLTPVPAYNEIDWIIPNWPQERG